MKQQDPTHHQSALPSKQALIEQFDLTPQQARVALLLAQRMRNAEIAEILYISPHTARHHTEDVFRNLGIHSRTEVHAAITPAVRGRQ
jgi:DNA-binding CsgD family transcriptional regulator